VRYFLFCLLKTKKSTFSGRLWLFLLFFYALAFEKTKTNPGVAGKEEIKIKFLGFG